MTTFKATLGSRGRSVNDLKINFCYNIMNYDLYEDEVNNSDCDFLDSDTPNEYEQPSSDYAFHLRITGERDKLKQLTEQYIAQYKPYAYAFAYEEVDDNHHIHGHLEYNKVPTKQSISQWMKVKGYSGKYYHQLVKTTVEANLIYICKDLDILYHNIVPSRMEHIMKKTKEINANKKLEQRHKLLMEYNKYIATYTIKDFQTTLFTLPALARWIMYHYINTYDKEPPLAHLKGYTIYIASKCDIKDKYETKLNQLFDNLF